MKGRVIVIGASFNGITALSDLMKALPADLPAAVLVVQHTSPNSRGFLPEVLARAGRLPVVYPREGQLVEPGLVFVAPPDRHMVVRPDGHIHLSHGPKENRTRPAVDVTFRSAALAFGAKVVGVVLTGYLDDGTAGLVAIKDRGGIAIVQDPAEATAPSMPSSALRHVAVDHRGTMADIARLLVGYALDAPGTDRTSPGLLEIEERISGGALALDDWKALERQGRSAALNCPDCRSALIELGDDRLIRFRCRSGHAFSALSLLDGQADARDGLQSALFAALLEEASLARRLLQAGEDPALLKHLRERADWLELHAASLSDWLDNPPPGDRGT